MANNNPPPLTRGVTTPTSGTIQAVSAGIDWLQWSIEWPHEITSWPADPDHQKTILSMALPPCNELFLLGEVIRPLPGYNAGTTATFARLFWHTTRKEQHIGVIMTGEDMRGLIGVAYPQNALLEWVVTHCSAITRMDLAVDVRGENLDPSVVLDAWKDGRLKSPSSRVTEMTSHEVIDHRTIEAKTVYVGARASDRQLRVYDKGANEDGDPGAWIRIELQLRHDRAMNVARMAMLEGIGYTAQAAIRAFCDFEGCGWWREATQGPAMEFEPIGRKDTNTERWIYNVVMPSLYGTIRAQQMRGERTLIDKLADMISEMDQGIKVVRDHDNA